MLTCEICGEEVLLEEDMKTHVLLSHMENDMQCPLCSLSGVSFDELSFHLSSAHPEERHRGEGPAPATSALVLSSTREQPGGCDRGKTCTAGNGEDPAGEVSRDSVHPGQNASTHAGCLSLFRERRPETSVSSSINGVRSENKERLFPCPMCPLVCSCPFTLQEHVELHLQHQPSDDAERRLECPMCSAVFRDSPSLQEHVELHLDHHTSGTPAGGSDSDLKLAAQLQHEEDQRRRQEEAQREREEFQKLQRQFGLGGGGGYRRQVETTLEKAVDRGRLTPAEFHWKRAEMMESLASGLDDGSTNTQGVVRALYDYYQTESKDCVHVWLSADTDHYCSSVGDKGWGCGYRNFQMLLSSLLRVDTYSSVLQEKAVPCIPRIQSLIEEAWKEGLDPKGASHFNQRLQGTRAWIGATEIYVLLTSLGISAHIVDFHQPTAADETHPRLFNWVKQYFCQSSRSSRLPPRLIQTCLPPLYLQHQGHSRSIVGLEQRKDSSLCLLLLDPGSSVSDTRKLLSRDTLPRAMRLIRKFPRNLKHRQYQLVAAQGVLSAEEKQMRVLNSRTLNAERIP